MLGGRDKDHGRDQDVARYATPPAIGTFAVGIEHSEVRDKVLFVVDGERRIGRSQIGNVGIEWGASSWGGRPRCSLLDGMVNTLAKCGKRWAAYSSL
jgi:hypothetical protein